MSKPDDGRHASELVQDAADRAMLRWSTGRIGGGAAEDARVLRMINALDALAGELGEIEQRRGRAAAVDGRFRQRMKQALASAATPFEPKAKPLTREAV